MSFTSVAALPQYDRVIRVDASSDNFATVAYLWADRVIDDGTNIWDARVLSLGDITRSLGEDRLATSASTSLALDNTDGALDAVVTGAAFGNLRFRIYLVLFVGDDFTHRALEPKLLGEFTMSTPAQERGNVITLSLGDDMLTRIGAGLMLPTFRDWYAVGNSTNNPLQATTGEELEIGVGLPDSLSYDTPIQLAFGEDWLQALPHVICPFNGNYNTEVIVPLYSTVDLSAVSQDLVSQVRIEWHDISNYLTGNGVAWRDLARTFVRGNNSPSIPDGPVWLVEKSPTITKNGRNFQIVYLRVQTHFGIGWPNIAGAGGQVAASGAVFAQLNALEALGGYPQGLINLMDPGVGSLGKYYRTVACRVLRWFVVAGPKSQIANPPAIGSASHAVDVATDLVTSYLHGTVDAVSAARVKDGNPNAAATGVVHPWTERQNYEPVPGQPNTLRQVMSKLAQSSDIDLFINWGGQLAFASDVWAWLAAGGTAAVDALAAYDETDVSELERWLPSEGERWAAFNRVYLEGAKTLPPEQLEVPFQGAFDMTSTQLDDLIPLSSRIVEVTLQQGWRPYRQQRDTPLNYRQVDGSSRWRVRFKTHLLFLQHDLGDYFRLTWHRDATSPALYDATVFQVEALAYSAASNEVTVEAIWRDDARTTRQYLLDDERYFDVTFVEFSLQAEDSSELQLESGESMLLESPYAAYVYSSGGRTWVTTPYGEAFSNLAVGDLFVTLYNASTPSPAWNIGVWRIDQIDTSGAAPGGYSAIRLVSHPDGTLPAASLPQTIPGSDWMIQHSPLTLVDLSHHPNGVRIYGCATNSSGQLSDNSIGNKITYG